MLTSSTESAAVERKRQRIVSLDQFRGYTVMGMFLVNFVGGFHACHYVLKHHNTFCSYADTIMPQFLFAVGFAFRLTFNRRVAKHGAAVAYYRVVKRLLGLVLVALVVYTVGPVADSWDQLARQGVWESIRVPLKRDWFQTLMHIAVTSLWILPVIRSSGLVRILFMLASALLHIFLSHVFYFEWVNSPPNGIDGGPLGFLTWTIPAIIGTLMCDLVTAEEGRWRIVPIMTWALILAAVGYVFSCGSRLYDVPRAAEKNGSSIRKFAERPVIPSRESLASARDSIQHGRWSDVLAEPPFVPPPHVGTDIGNSYRYRQWNYWMMGQRAGTLSYLTFSAGFSVAVFLLFYICCDRFGWQLSIFRTFGTNALAGYVLHMLVDSALNPFMPRDCPAWYMWLGCAIFMGITYLLVRSLEKSDIYIRV